MDDLGPATDDHVILAWLQAEIDSPDFQRYVVGDPPNPSYLSIAVKAAHAKDASDATENALRRRIISKAYGFGLGTGTFAGLVNDIQWRRLHLTTQELTEVQYANRKGPWTLLAPATRKVAEGATNVGHVFTGDSTNMLVLSLAASICHGDKVLPPVIALRRIDGGLVILEGHTRATAIVLEAHRFPRGVEIYAGESSSVVKWPFA